MSKDLPAIKEHDAIYIAGLFDGEGSIVIHRRKPSVKLRSPAHNDQFTIIASIVNSHEGVMRWLQDEVLGGCGYMQVRQPKPGQRQHVMTWKIILQCHQAAQFCRAIQPYLKIKGPEVEIALTLHAHIREGARTHMAGRRGKLPISPEQMSYRQALHDRLLEVRRAYKQYAHIS